MQKVIKIGTSIGVTLSKDAAHASGIHAGDQIQLVEAKNGRIAFEVVQSHATPSNEEDAAKWAVAFVSKHIDAFKELADK